MNEASSEFGRSVIQFDGHLGRATIAVSQRIGFAQSRSSDQSPDFDDIAAESACLTRCCGLSRSSLWQEPAFRLLPRLRFPGDWLRELPRYTPFCSNRPSGESVYWRRVHLPARKPPGSCHCGVPGPASRPGPGERVRPSAAAIRSGLAAVSPSCVDGRHFGVESGRLGGQLLRLHRRHPACLDSASAPPQSA